MIFNDSAGDYHGLDSVSRIGNRKADIVGYQYKFYSSPLTDPQRADIEKSLLKAREASKKLKLTKWVLVTPDDLIESGRRKAGGDVTWFEGLKAKHELRFDCEHWGHTKLLALFLETRSLCLFYYPELIAEGHKQKQSIQRVRADYDENLISQYRQIEFVGMSVYKPEATRGVPMEDIYIPLSVADAELSGSMDDPPRTDPVSLLRRGSRSVILGDPGSGKSTLLRFLSLVGTSVPLQTRYKAPADDRLPVLVVLRRYADELKARNTLSILDYIKETTRADFSLAGVDDDFFEYYLDSGSAILCFDGLDELPGAEYKQRVRDRIRSFITSFPGNTTLVTSRVIGYDEPFRFDTTEFQHYRVTGLQLPEIEQFVRDWYAVRVDNPRDRDANITDLIRIVRDPEHRAIRELAENPLLLTIVALVHRIDAVLPDERVVLYQKCTETLLNTWHTWKYKGLESKHRGKTERKNRRRMETLALWVHSQSGGTSKSQRAVIPYEQLRDTLAKHIAEVEKPTDTEDDPEDLANEFLQFVKTRAGLLLEVGDDQYSFIHLTFQEYLASSGIITQCEKDGVNGVWRLIEPNLNDPRWHEVIRLLTAGLKSDESQEFLVEQMLVSGARGELLPVDLLLGGLLVDGISAAEARAGKITERLIGAIRRSPVESTLQPLFRVLEAWATKDPENQNLLNEHLTKQEQGVRSSSDAREIALIRSILAPGGDVGEITRSPYLDSRDRELLMITSDPEYTATFPPDKGLERFWRVQSSFLLTSPLLNLAAAAGHAFTESCGSALGIQRAFAQILTVIASGVHGPFHDLMFNWLYLSVCADQEKEHRLLDWIGVDDLSLDGDHLSLRLEAADEVDRLVQELFMGGGSHSPLFARVNAAAARALRHGGSQFRSLAEFRERADSHHEPLIRRISRRSGGMRWQDAVLPALISSPLAETIVATFRLGPKELWASAIQARFVPTVPRRFSLVDTTRWEHAISEVANGGGSDEQNYTSAWLLLLETWLAVHGHKPLGTVDTLASLAESARRSERPELILASAIRDAVAGNLHRLDAAQALLRSEDPAVRELLGRSHLLPGGSVNARQPGSTRSTDDIEATARQVRTSRVKDK